MYSCCEFEWELGKFSVLQPVEAMNFLIILALVPIVLATVPLNPRAQHPSWPEHFQTKWTIYDVPHEQPWPPYSAEPATPYAAGSGATYYDWAKRAIIEVYNDFCVPIFVNGSNWPCRFLNVDNVAYLISPSKLSGFPDCCVFGKPWSPPEPTFLDAPGIFLNQTSKLGGAPVDWYEMPGSADEGAPFGYGFFKTETQGWRTPAGFYFRAVQGWTQQNFYDFEVKVPDAHWFDLPPQCKSAPSCGFF